MPIGEKLTSYGYPDPFIDHDLTIIPLNIRVQYRYDGNYNYYRMTGTLVLKEYKQSGEVYGSYSFA